MRRLIAGLVVFAVVVGVVVLAANLIADQLAKPFAFDECVASVEVDNTELRAEVTLEQAENAALVSAVSVRRGLPARAASIGIAAAFQETDLRNLEYGDRDSLGLFQQRPSQGWGSEEQLLDPYYATAMFYQHLIKVDGYLSMPIDEAAQAVQRSADGSLYAQHEMRARALASALTGQSPAAFSCTLVDVPAESSPSGLSDELANAFGELDVAVDRRRVVVDTPQEGDLGWAVAHWALAYSKRYGVTEVSYAGNLWTAERSEAGWQVTEQAPGDRVVIRF